MLLFSLELFGGVCASTPKKLLLVKSRELCPSRKGQNHTGAQRISSAAIRADNSDFFCNTNPSDCCLAKQEEREGRGNTSPY